MIFFLKCFKMIIAVQLEKNLDQMRRPDNKSPGVTIIVEKSPFVTDMWLGSPLRSPAWVWESLSCSAGPL